VSVAWNATRLTGERSWLPVVKLRMAYGEAGREPNPYQILTGYDPAFLAGNGGLVTSFTKGQDSLRPERTKEFEAGIDLGLFRGYAEGSVTYYRARTDDAIFAVPLAQSNGFGFQERNAASIDNRGWELALNVHPLQGPGVRWDVDVTWAHNANRVLSLRGVTVLAFNDGEFSSVVLPGYPVGSFYMSDFVRCRYGETNVRVNDSGTPTDINAYCKAHGAPNGALFGLSDPRQRHLIRPRPFDSRLDRQRSHRDHVVPQAAHRGDGGRAARWADLEWHTRRALHLWYAQGHRAA
jgi:outer membrane receptor protein involved in Fe transport